MPLPLVLKSPDVFDEERLVFKKSCKYIGSVAVTQVSKDEKQRYVNEKLHEMKDAGKGVPIVMLITEEGVKIFKEDGSSVKMAHGITRLAFTICHPVNRLFAYVAKSLNVNKKVVIQAHMFKTKKSSHVHQLSLNFAKAFEISHASGFTLRKQRNNLFETEAKDQKAPSQKTNRGKKWAKLEIARGHDNAGHAKKRQGKYGSTQISQLMHDLENNATSEVSEYNSPVTSPTKSNAAKKELNLYEEPLISPESHLNQIKGVTPKTCLISTYENDEPNINGSVPASSYEVANPTDLHQSNNKIIYQKNDKENTNNNIIDLTPNRSLYSNISSSSQNEFIRPTCQFSNIDNENAFDEDEYLNMSTPDYQNIVNGIVGYTIVDDVFDQGNKKRTNSNEIEEYDNHSPTLTEDEILKQCEWYQPGFSREIAEELLNDRSIGSFFVRDSQTHTGCYAMTLKVPESYKPNMVGNFLIEKLKNNDLRIKGFSHRFRALTDLIAYYGSIKQDIPCQLHLSQDNVLSQRRLYIDEPDNGSQLVSDDDWDDWDDGEPYYEDVDYENLTSNDNIMKELLSMVSVNKGD